MTPALAPDETHTVNAEVKPNKRKVLKKIRRGNRRIKKKLTVKITGASTHDDSVKDVAGLLIQHK